MKKKEVEVEDRKLTGEKLGGMINLVEDGRMRSKIGKKVFVEFGENGGEGKEMMEEKGLVEI
nr:hypothetical protein [Staphylococcus auricularis]